MSNTRWVLVDDKEVKDYSGSWFETNNAFSGNWGAPLGGSQHGTNGTGSFSYTFTGTRIRVLGTSAVFPATAAQDPTWTCIVDSTAITPNDPWTATINNWPLCESPTYTPGTHTLTLNASAKNSTFLFDQIRYLPLANQTDALKSATVIVEHNDPGITYVTQDWQPLTSSAMMTLKAGSVMTAKFNGTKLTWVGWTPSGYPTGKSEATYSVDGGPATTFDINGLPDRSPALYNQHLFATPDLGEGEHTLTVTHNGPSAPLTLDHFLVEHGDILLPGGSTMGDETQDDAATASGTAVPDKKPVPIGAIAGGAAGGAAFLIILILVIILFWRKRKRKQRLERVDVLGGGVKFPAPIAQVTPFTYGGNAGPRPPGALNMMAPSQENLNQASQMPAGWGASLGSPGGGYQPINNQIAPYPSHQQPQSYPRDRKVRPLPQPNAPQSIPLREFTNSPGPLSDTSSASGAPLIRPGGGAASSYSGTSGSGKSTSGPAERPQILMHHQDSGLRLNGPEAGGGLVAPAEIVDVPPSYTPS